MCDFLPQTINLSSTFQCLFVIIIDKHTLINFGIYLLSVSHLNRLKYAVSLELPSLLYCSIIDESKKMFGEDVLLEHEHPEVENMYV